MTPKKPAPDLIQGGHRFSEKVMRLQKPPAADPKSSNFTVN
jgi:hypothetical protein